MISWTSCSRCFCFHLELSTFPPMVFETSSRVRSAVKVCSYDSMLVKMLEETDYRMVGLLRHQVLIITDHPRLEMTP